MTKNTIKKWKNPNVLLIGQNTYFRVFPTFWWYDLSNDFIHKFSKQIFQWKTKSSLGILLPNPISSTLFRD